MWACCANAANSAKALVVAEPMAKPLPMDVVVLPGQIVRVSPNGAGIESLNVIQAT